MNSHEQESWLAGITPANMSLSTQISQANMDIGNAMKSNLLHLGRNDHFG